MSELKVLEENQKQQIQKHARYQKNENLSLNQFLNKNKSFKKQNQSYKKKLLKQYEALDQKAKELEALSIKRALILRENSIIKA